ncbi:MAG TPA: hypothetical protein PKV71_13390 [Calditrichia bacterium]|nr:outer membrane beta-barrel protein [Calditrichota bacterium]HQU74533.1 hypothetical protein [Calditrichia bacterium]HQV32872.1 hypothetical protein [Calditrichia bacterium]
MKKLFLILIVSVALSQVAFAQGEMRIGGAANLALPFGDLGDVGSSVGFGVTGLFVYSFSDVIDFTGTLGWMTFGGESTEFPGYKAEYTVSTIPILFGVRYYIQKPSSGPQWHVGGEAGFHRWSVDTKITSDNPFVNNFSGGVGSSTEFDLGAAGGFTSGNLDISAVFFFINTQYIGIRAGYTVPLGN